MGIQQCLSLESSQHLSKGKVFHQECPCKLMLILHLIYFPEMLVTEWKSYRLVSRLQEKKCKMEEISPSTKTTSENGKVMHSIDPESIMKSSCTKQKILDVNPDVFKGLRTFPGDPYNFKLKENHAPARHAPRKVPIHLQDDFHHKINDLVKQGVLEKVEHSTERVNSYL